MEYAPKIKVAHVKDLEIEGMEIDYIHSERTEAAEKNARKAEEGGRRSERQTGVVLRLDQLRLTNARWAW
jgi:hypothetical protein